jgi:hypothetical protein
MQTFIPVPSFEETAAILDNRRLGKQRVEAKQILLALGVPVGEHDGKASSRWRHHPAVRMWLGFERCLAHYAIAVCREWRSRGFRDSLEDQFVDASRWIVATFRDISPSSVCGVPSWIGDESVHASHRSNLLRKFPEHYSQFGWNEPATLPYVWPT